MSLAMFEHVARGGNAGPRIIFPLLLLSLLLLLGGWFLRRRGSKMTHHHRGQGSPMRTLGERFARGEIDRDEFDHRKAVLLGADVVPPAPERPAPAYEPDAQTDDEYVDDVEDVEDGDQ